VAEREGFEPSTRFYPGNALAVRPVRPLQHLSARESGWPGARSVPLFLTPPGGAPRIARRRTGPAGPSGREVFVRFRIAALLAGFLLLPLAATQARAQNRGNSWEFGPYLVFTDYDSLTEINDDEGLGFRFGYNFTPLHQLE